MAEIAKIESGRVGINNAPSAAVPVVNFPQITPEIALIGQAKYQGTVADKLNRMSAILFNEGQQLSQRAGLQFAAENPMTTEQLQAMARGDMSTVALGSPINVFDSAVRKARAIELSAHAEMEGTAILKDLIQKANFGELSTEQVADKVRSLTNGYSSALAEVDPDASYKYRARMATLGSATINDVAQSEGKKRIATNLFKAQTNQDNTLFFIKKTYESVGKLPVNPDTGEQFTADQIVGALYQTEFNNLSLLVGKDKASEMSGELLKKINATKANVMSQYFMSDEFGKNVTERLGKLKANDGGKFGDMWTVASLEFKDSVFNQMKNYSDNIRKGIDAEFNQAELDSLPLMRELITTNDPARAKQIAGKLTSMPLDPEKLKGVKSYMASEGAGASTDDPMTYFQLTSKAARGQLGINELISNQSKLTKGSFKSLVGDIANPNNDVSYGVDKINLAVNIQQSNLPPELPTAEARQAAVGARNRAYDELRTFTNTPNEKGLFPTGSEIRKKADDLAKDMSKSMSPIFTGIASANQNTAVMLVPELAGIDLNNQAAVDQAFTKAAGNSKRKAQDISAAKTAVENYRKNYQKSQSGE